MNCPSERFICRTANPADSREILEILEEEDFKGSISLLYTRRPDAYLSLIQEGEDVQIIVYQDNSSGQLVGVGVCAIRMLWVNGRAEKVGYLLGLRMRSAYRKKFTLLPKAYQAMQTALAGKGCTYFYTTILSDNVAAQQLLEKKRSIMPLYEPFGEYEVYILKTKAAHGRKSDYVFRKAAAVDLPQLADFLAEQGSKCQFYPVMREEHLQGAGFPGLTNEHFYLLTDKSGQIQAAGAAWDQQSYKQYILQSYGGILKYIRPLSALFPWFNYPALPKPGTVLNFFTLSFWAVRDNNPEVFSNFIQEVSAQCLDYPFFVIGAHQQNPLQMVLSKQPHIKYSSKVYLVNWLKTEPLANSLDDGLIPYLECGTL